MNNAKEVIQEDSVQETKHRPIYRNAFRQGMVRLLDINNVNFDSYPVFEINPTDDDTGGSKFILKFSDPGLKTITMPMPDKLTDDVTLSDGDWIIEGAKLIANSRRLAYNNVLKKRFLSQVAEQVAILVINNDNGKETRQIITAVAPRFTPEY